MKNKALNTLYSAQCLINNQRYTSSIHCSYYAVLQYMKYMLANTSNNPIDYTAQNNHIGESSHDYIFDEICNRISNPSNERRFKQFFKNLKKDRVEADYSIRNFSCEESLDCKQNADALITQLKTVFGNI